MAEQKITDEQLLDLIRSGQLRRPRIGSPSDARFRGIMGPGPGTPTRAEAPFAPIAKGGGGFKSEMLKFLSGIASNRGDVLTALNIARIPFGGAINIVRKSSDPTGLGSFALTKAMAMNPNIFRTSIPVGGGFSFDILGNKNDLRFATFLTEMFKRNRGIR